MAIRWLIVFLVVQLVWAVPGEAGREYSIFELGHGARALALGSAFVAHEPEAASLFWNPAALGYAAQRELATLHAGLPTDASYFYLGGIFPTPLARFGMSWVQLQMADIPETTTVNAENEVEVAQYLTYTETAAALGAGTTLNDTLAVGLAIKTLTQELDNYGAGHGLAGTFGVLCKVGPSLNVGAVVDNLSGSVRYNSGYIENTPAVYRLGLSYVLLPQVVCLLDVDRRAESDSFMRGHFGVEYLLTAHTYIAGGYDNDRITAGAGFSWDGIYAQYAFLAENRYSAGTEQFVTLGVRW